MAQEEQATSGNSNASFDAAYKDVRADSDVQFTIKEFKPSESWEPKEPVEAPQWWQDFMSFLSDFFTPIAKFFGAAWPILQYILLGLLVIGVLALLWVILAPYIEDWKNRRPKEHEEEEWRPEESTARRWLDEADALADKGQFEEAVHLLLYRSIEDIENRRPDLLRPSNTSREIGRFESLPDKARDMFAVIADHVEHGIFGATPIGRDGWTSARNAYGEFALKDSWKAVARG